MHPTSDSTALSNLLRALSAAAYSFVTPTPATHALVNARAGCEWAEDARGVFGWSRPFRHGVLPHAVMDAAVAAGVLENVPGGWRSTVRASSLDGLLFLHSAFPTADTASVFFGPDTYRFAQAIGTVLQRPVHRAVDIGCGAGPGAILVARAHPAAQVLAVDINEAALRLTRANAEAAGMSIEAVWSDLLGGVAGQFDLIVSNPPYLIDPAARAYRHGGGALGAGLSLLILQTALERLAPGGTLLLYTGAAIVNGEDRLRGEIAARLGGTGVQWSYREMDPDVFGEELATGAYAQTDRIAAVVLTATK